MWRDHLRLRSIRWKVNRVSFDLQSERHLLLDKLYADGANLQFENGGITLQWRCPISRDATYHASRT